MTVSGVPSSSPQPAPPNPSEWDTGRVTSNFYIEQIASIRRLRRWATVVAVVALLSLIGALGLTVWSFTEQIDKATPKVNLEEMVAKARAAKNDSVAPPLPTPNSRTGSGAKIPVSLPAPAAAGEPVIVATSVSVDISSIGNSIVAVVSILVVAIAVLAISLLRTTYTLSVEGLRGRAEAKPVEVDTSLPIPGAELVKSIGEAITTILKGIPSKKD